jgi:hypothetical protein
MTPNILILALCAFIPFAVAFLWYSKPLFGGTNWNAIANLTEEQANKKVKPLQLASTLVLNFLIAFGLSQLVLHQMGVFSLVGGNAELLKTGTGAAFLAEYGGNHLTFGHGLFHGIMAAILLFVPFLGYTTIFDRKSKKYFFVNLGYWVISLGLMGGVIAVWGGVPII